MYKSILRIAIVLLALAMTMQPAAAGAAEQGATATVTITETIDVTLNTSSIGFGTQSPGDTFQAVGTSWPVKVTLNPTTNIRTNISIKSYDSNFGNATSATNFSVSNMAVNDTETFTGAAIYNMSTSYQMFTLANGTANGKYNWTNITCPCAGGSSYDNYIYSWLSIPPGTEAAIYTANLAIKVYKWGTSP